MDCGVTAAAVPLSSGLEPFGTEASAAGTRIRHIMTPGTGRGTCDCARSPDPSARIRGFQFARIPFELTDDRNSQSCRDMRQSRVFTTLPTNESVH